MVPGFFYAIFVLMAKIKYDPAEDPLRKEHSGYTFIRNTYGQSMLSSQRNGRTRYASQWEKMQAIFRITKAWSTLGLSIQANWDAFAAAYPQPSKRNPAVFLSGYQLFIKRNTYCLYNFGQLSDLMTEPTMEVIPEDTVTIAITNDPAADLVLDVTETFIARFGLLPEQDDTLLYYLDIYGAYNGQFYTPLQGQINVDNIYIDGLFVSFYFAEAFQPVTVSLFLSKPVSPGRKFITNLIRYMGCAQNSGSFDCNDLLDCSIILQLQNAVNSLRQANLLWVTQGWSTDGINWTLGTNPQSNPWGIATDGYLFVCVGQTSPYMVYSYDGKTWYPTPDQPFTSRGCGIAWNGSLWVAMGYGTNTVAYSTDGLHWTGLGYVFSTYGYGVAWNGDYWIGLGNSTYNIKTSIDGINWTNRNNTMFSSYSCHACWNGSIWVAGGAGSVNTLAWSSDGINWTGLGKTIFSTFCWGIAWNGTMFVAGGYGSTHTIAYSYDGVNWTGLGNTIFTTYGMRPSWNGTMWVICGYGTNNLAYSYDGINWTGQSVITLSNNIRAIACLPSPCLYPAIL